MNRERKYLIVLTVVLLVYVLVQVLAPKEHTWQVTLYHQDKGPYGTYVLRELMPDVFPAKTIRHSNLTAYEWLDSIPPRSNFITLSITFNPAAADVNALLNYAEQGGNILVAAEFFYGPFADTLGIRTENDLITLPEADGDNTDSTFITSQSHVYKVKRDHVRSCFAQTPTNNTEVLATNASGYAVLMRIPKGQGAIWLSSTPLIFTNINMLHDSTAYLAERCLTRLPSENVYWTEYYYRGRQEAASMLRYILMSEPLRWAYYTTIGAGFLYMLFAARRRQRAIPVIKPPANTTLEFVQTIGNLYFQTGDHKRIAEKRIAWLLEEWRTRLYMPGLQPTPEWAEPVSKKTGYSLTEIQGLFQTIQTIWQKPTLSEAELRNFSQKLDKLTGLNQNKTPHS